MDREYILNLIREDAKEKINKGILGCVLGGIALIVTLVSYFLDGSIVLMGPVLFILSLGAGIVEIIGGIRQQKNPMQAKILKENPDLFRQVEDILTTELYKDNYIALSERAIANANDYLQIAYRDEVFLVYLYTEKTNGMTSLRQVKLETARGTILIRLDKEKQEEVNEIIFRICENCKYAKAGYTQEGLAYLEQMRELWKRNKTGGQIA